MEIIHTDITIIGAGASGLFAAWHCSSNGKSVCLVDHNKQIGRKILVSGGGRCNFTNLFSKPSDFQSSNPHFCKSALAGFTPNDFMKIIKKHKIDFFEKKLGQLFCKKSANEIVKLLHSQIQKENVKLFLGQENLEVEKTNDIFKVSNKSVLIESSSLVIATGGLSMPEIGASDFGYTVAKMFGHSIIPPTPALVPFLLPGFNQLAGVSLVGEVTCNKQKIKEDILFTHKGLSGPAILKISLYWNSGDSLAVNWLPQITLKEILSSVPGKTKISTILKKYLPKKFVSRLLDNIELDEHINVAEISKKMILKLEDEIHNFKLIPKKTEGFKKAEVTKGGVDTKQIFSKNMESRIIPKLFFIGEVLDVTGILGGHNFQWAWASAYSLAKHMGDE